MKQVRATALSICAVILAVSLIGPCFATSGPKPVVKHEPPPAPTTPIKILHGPVIDKGIKLKI